MRPCSSTPPFLQIAWKLLMFSQVPAKQPKALGTRQSIPIVGLSFPELVGAQFLMSRYSKPK